MVEILCISVVKVKSASTPASFVTLSIFELILFFNLLASLSKAFSIATCSELSRSAEIALPRAYIIVSDPWGRFWYHSGISAFIFNSSSSFNFLISSICFLNAAMYLSSDVNSYSGIAAAGAGFVLNNPVLIISGSLVGASGLILTRIMTKAMNRSLANVILGGLGSEDGSKQTTTNENKLVKSLNTEDAAMILKYAENVIFVPGYGLAVAQAQHQINELANILKNKGANIKYAIHPVAGRMPGHMNVLLAEANIPYNELKDLDEINSEFDNTDVAVVVGANDVTNPIARTDPNSPIYGMPILNVDKAKSVIVLKRSMASGFAWIENELFFLDKTSILFGDARNSIEEVTREIKNLDNI